MAVQITIPEKDTACLKQPAIEELKSCVKQFSEDLVKEAGRLEAGRNTAHREPEITSSMVKDANLLLRQGYSRPRRSWVFTFCKLVSAILAFISGLFADMDRLQSSPGTLIGFIILVIVAVLATFYVSFKE